MGVPDAFGADTAKNRNLEKQGKMQRNLFPTILARSISFKYFLRIALKCAVCVLLSASLTVLPAAFCQGEDSKQDSHDLKDFEKVEAEKVVDLDDIEVKVDKAIKVAEGSKRGVVWGKTNIRTDETEDTRVAQRTTVKRPVAKPLIAAPKNPLAATNKPETGHYVLQSSRKVGSTDLVETLLEVSGDAKQVDNDMKSITERMEVVAGFRYEERVAQFSPAGKNLNSVRQYNLAKGKMRIGKDVKTPQLEDRMQTIVCTLTDSNKVSLFSPKGPLRGTELLLIEDLPGNTLTLDRLLPNQTVKIGNSWKIENDILQSFLSIDAVDENNVEAVLTAVADNMAMIEAVGDVQGVYLGAPTEMTIRAKYQFDLGLKRINWLGLLIEEKRSVGHVGPGFDLVARLQVKISPLEEPQSLTDGFVQMVNMRPNDKILGLKYDEGRAPWRFRHGRDWYVFQDDATTTILRKVHQGELVAQCNIADMGKVDIKTMTTLAKFKKELVAGLGENFSEVVHADESNNQFGYKVYSVLIDGLVDDLELRWIYNLVTDEKTGQQAVVVFVVEGAMLDRFGDADEALMNTFQFGRNDEETMEN